MFTGLKLTAKGSELLVNLLNGHRIEFTKIKMGDGAAPTAIEALTDLVSVKQVLPIARKSAINETTMLIGANLYGKDITAAFYWKEIGIFAKDLDGDNKEYLFSYDNAGDQASYIPAGGAVTEQLIDLNIYVGNAANVVINIDKSLVYVTISSMETSLADLEGKLNKRISDTSTAQDRNLTKHTTNYVNPHKVNKTHVGLGNVENYPIASLEEARAGVALDKYMTPYRVKNAVEAFGVISDGNIIIKIGGTQPAKQTGKTIIWINTAS